MTAANKDYLNNDGISAGKYVETIAGEETMRAYVPSPLSASLVYQLGTEIFDLMERANRALNRDTVNTRRRGAQPTSSACISELRITSSTATKRGKRHLS